jgi:hypothetical protein
VSKNTSNKNTSKNEAELALDVVKPKATELQGGDYLITGCDGEQTYLWIARAPKRSKRFKVTEVYPGVAVKRTRLRDADGAEDIELEAVKGYETIEGVVEDLTEILLDGVDEAEVEEEEGEDPSSQTVAQA